MENQEIQAQNTAQGGNRAKPITRSVSGPLSDTQTPSLEAVEDLIKQAQEAVAEMKWDHPDQLEDKPQIRRGTEGNWDIAREGVVSQDHPLFAVCSDALGISKREATADHQQIEEIINLVVNTIKSDNPDDVFDYLSQQLRKSDGTSYRAIIRRLQFSRRVREGIE